MIYRLIIILSVLFFAMHNKITIGEFYIIWCILLVDLIKIMMNMEIMIISIK